jgi:lipopolysaccharide/colanic/teichoic acid biosynthesis glycosyltransferase
MIKRIFDIFFSSIALVLIGWAIVLFWLLACIDTKSNGIFIQNRIGQFGRFFKIYKLRTIHPKTKKISSIGYFFRKSKIDEWPQLINVLFGTMSVVGPRPDISGYYDKLEGEYEKILKLKPGLTSLAAIKYADEELLLAQQEDPLTYNDSIIFPDKVKMNLEYYYNNSIFGDIKIIIKTIFR